MVNTIRARGGPELAGMVGSGVRGPASPAGLVAEAGACAGLVAIQVPFAGPAGQATQDTDRHENQGEQADHRLPIGELQPTQTGHP